MGCEGMIRMGRTNIVIDDDLIARVMSLTGVKSKREAVEIALRRLMHQESAFRALRQMRGQAPWEGDIDRWRRDRV